jgi:ribonuclease J
VLCTPEESGVKGRRRLSFGGMIIVSLCVNSSGQVVSGPDFVIEGLPETEDESIVELVEDTVTNTIKSMPPKRRSDPDAFSSALFRSIRNEVNGFWGRKPNVNVFVHRV